MAGVNLHENFTGCFGLIWEYCRQKEPRVKKTFFADNVSERSKQSGGDSLSIIIQGNKSLKGDVRISTSKNAVLPILAASLLTEDDAVICRTPALTDVYGMLELLRGLGANVHEEDGQVCINASGVNNCQASYEWVQRMRASILVMGPLLVTKGHVRMSLPGGCAIGTRPINLHLKGLEALGATIESGAGYIEARATKLIGNTVYLDMPSVGATENIMMAAALAQGTTRLENAAKEPEIIDLANFLNSMGANVRGAGDSTVIIEGVSHLHGTEYTPIPDRIEAGTMLIIAAATGGNVMLRDAQPDHLRAVIAKLRECGVKINEYPGGLRVRGVRPRPVDVKTLVYPGFPTDLQAPMMSLLSIAKGTSVVTETIFENRFMQVAELRRMGANIRLDDRIAVIEGVRALSGANVHATDLRAGAALIVAGLAAEGSTTITGTRHIDRGYEDIEGKLFRLGAQIYRQNSQLEYLAEAEGQSL